MNDVKFSRRLSIQMGIHPRFRKHLRVAALLLTVGELIVGWIAFKRADFLGAYAMGAYLAKEHVISRIIGE
jgi:hypothetical protein